MLERLDATCCTHLLELPFVETSRDGIVVHDAVREAVAGILRSTNPVQHRQYRRAAWRELRSEVREAPPADLWRYTADMLYLIDNPVVREAFFPSPALSRSRSSRRARATPRRWRRSRRTTKARLQRRLLDRWWEEAPETFSVSRDRDGVVVGLLLLLADDRTYGRRACPIRSSTPGRSICATIRCRRGSRCSAFAAGSTRSVVSSRARRRPRPGSTSSAPTWRCGRRCGGSTSSSRTCRPTGRSSSGSASARSRTRASSSTASTYTTVVLDFGPGSVDGWLAGLVAAELGLDDEPGFDEDARELLVSGERVSLTPLEFGLFVASPEPRGQDGLARRAAARGLGHRVHRRQQRRRRRRALAARQARRRRCRFVETVRGSGYRLRADWRAQLR